ncbi:MAG TPA: hypothetical protein VN851_04235, partial [Thermoanaerobaculia bacterium]|nr:hypothetical protein [Thermoanaerobaculia bacterium]
MSRTGASVTLGWFLLALVNLEASQAASLEDLGKLPLVGESQLTVRRLALSPLAMTPQLKQEAVVHELVLSEAEGWVRDMFASARWDFLPDGTVRLLLHSLQKDGQELPVEEIAGTYRRGPGSVEIHVSVQPGPLLLHASLDGVLRETEEGYRLDAVIAVNLLVEQWHFEIHQILKPREPPAASEASVVWFDGIPQPSVFEVQVTGRAGSLEIASASAILMFGPPDRFGPVSVGLVVPKTPGPGTLFWNSPEETTRSASYKIEVREGRVTVHFDRARGEAPEIWWVDPELSNISGGRGRLDVEVRGDEISGELRIETLLADTSWIYEAKLHGRRRKMSLNAALSLFLPAAPLEAAVGALGLVGGNDGEIAG